MSFIIIAGRSALDELDAGSAVMMGSPASGWISSLEDCGASAELDEMALTASVAELLRGVCVCGISTMLVVLPVSDELLELISESAVTAGLSDSAHALNENKVVIPRADAAVPLATVESFVLPDTLRFSIFIFSPFSP